MADQNPACKRAKIQLGLATPVSTLPHEIILEILPKLPAKALLRFRCVCNSWNSIILDPQFSNLHWKRPCLLFYEAKNDSFEFTTLNYEALSADRCDDSALTHLYGPWEADIKTKWGVYCKILGSCNGLICLAFIRENVILWNPSTRQFKTLPPAPHSLPTWRCYGFGFDKYCDDCKLVIAYGPSSEPIMEIHVFATKSNNWKRISDTEFQIKSSYGIFLDGALHWQATSGPRSQVCKEYIVAFDLGEEKFEDLLLPDLDGCFHKTIGVLGGLLSLCSQHKEAGGVHRTDVWTMKEYGVQSSWTKLFTVPPEIMKVYKYPCRFNPLFFTKEGEIMALVGGSGDVLVKFNIQNLSFETLLDRRRLFPFSKLPHTLLHMESLVLL